jgi:hypothetical protein
LAAALVAALAIAAPRASAEEAADGSAAAAESLFQEARRLMGTKDYREACPKFLASQRIAPAVGTLLNLADCYEKNGQLASAWARFHEAIAFARRIGRADREKVARERADRLEPRLLRLTITSATEGVDVTLDGAPLDEAALGTGVPVDPGEHTIKASAEGKLPFSTTIEVSERTRSVGVEIPPLEDALVVIPPQSAPSSDAPEPERGARGGTARIVGAVAMGAGAVAIGVGAFFGIRTQSKWSEAQRHCSGIDCDATGFTLANEARSSGDVATIAFIAGGALVAGGAILYLTAPRGAASSRAKGSAVGIGIGPSSVAVGGTF